MDVEQCWYRGDSSSLQSATKFSKAFDCPVWQKIRLVILLSFGVPSFIYSGYIGVHHHLVKLWWFTFSELCDATWESLSVFLQKYQSIETGFPEAHHLFLMPAEDGFCFKLDPIVGPVHNSNTIDGTMNSFCADESGSVPDVQGYLT